MNRVQYKQTARIEVVRVESLSLSLFYYSYLVAIVVFLRCIINVYIERTNNSVIVFYQLNSFPDIRCC